MYYYPLWIDIFNICIIYMSYCGYYYLYQFFYVSLLLWIIYTYNYPFVILLLLFCIQLTIYCYTYIYCYIGSGSSPNLLSPKRFTILYQSLVVNLLHILLILILLLHILILMLILIYYLTYVLTSTHIWSTIFKCKVQPNNRYNQWQQGTAVLFRKDLF